MNSVQTLNSESTDSESVHMMEELNLDEARKQPYVSDRTILSRLDDLWDRLIKACQALSLHGYERTATAVALTSFKQHVLNDRCTYLYDRCQKRTSASWEQTQPTEVVMLCRDIIHCYDEIITLATGTPIYKMLS